MSELLVGWCEWASLPQLDIEQIQLKVDTGARTSALHAVEIETFQRDGVDWLRFVTKPSRQSNASLTCEAPLLEYRTVSNSGGHKQRRPVIRTELCLGGRHWPIDITLTDRSSMRFPMLLGRRAMTQLRVDPNLSYVQGEP